MLSNYAERITLFDCTHIMSMINHVTMSVEIIKINNGCSLEK